MGSDWTQTLLPLGELLGHHCQLKNNYTVSVSCTQDFSYFILHPVCCIFSQSDRNWQNRIWSTKWWSHMLFQKFDQSFRIYEYMYFSVLQMLFMRWILYNICVGMIKPWCSKDICFVKFGDFWNVNGFQCLNVKLSLSCINPSAQPAIEPSEFFTRIVNSQCNCLPTSFKQISIRFSSRSRWTSRLTFAGEQLTYQNWRIAYSIVSSSSYWH